MTIIDFTRNGGYRLKQFTFKMMQEATFHILKMFVSFCNLSDTGNYIISGCKVVGPNITAGYMYIGGDLCYFPLQAGSAASKILKVVTYQPLVFKNGITEPNIFRTTAAVVDSSGPEALSSFSSLFPVFDENYVHTDNNFTNNLKNLAANSVQFVARGDAGGYFSLVANVEYSDTIFVTLAAPVPFGNIDLTITPSGAYPVQYIVGGLASGSNTFYITFKVKSPVSGSQLVAFNYLIVKSN